MWNRIWQQKTVVECIPLNWTTLIILLYSQELRPMEFEDLTALNPFIVMGNPYLCIAQWIALISNWHWSYAWLKKQTDLDVLVYIA